MIALILSEALIECILQKPFHNTNKTSLEKKKTRFGNKTFQYYDKKENAPHVLLVPSYSVADALVYCCLGSKWKPGPDKTQGEL